MSTTKITTPKGTAVYPSLTKPDTRYNPEGVYKTGLSLSGKDADTLVEQIKDVFKEEFGSKKDIKTAQLPFKVNEDGTTTFNFKTKNAPKLFDSKGNPIRNASELNIGGGSTIRVQGAAQAYNKGGKVGVTVYLNAVQIVNLVEYTGNPFGVEEGGFEAAAEEKFADESSNAEVDF
jgi:hypothetical protein